MEMGKYMASPPSLNIENSQFNKEKLLPRTPVEGNNNPLDPNTIPMWFVRIQSEMSFTALPNFFFIYAILYDRSRVFNSNYSRSRKTLNTEYIPLRMCDFLCVSLLFAVNGIYKHVDL